MGKTYAVLPCNGLDKCAGRLAGELAVRLSEAAGGEIICPVLFRLTDTRYKKLAGENPLLVIDGCATRCASKLAAEKGLKVARKMTVAEEAKKRDITLGSSLRLGAGELGLVDDLMTAILQEDEKKEGGAEGHGERAVFPTSFDYETYMKDKFIFRLPREGFQFNENDCWVYIVGKVARVGLTDYAQKVLSDIMFFTPPSVGAEIDQFGELGSVESGKAVFEVISPVSGKVTAVNEDLLAAPELINESPFEKGWVAELELTDIENDRELLLDFEGYFEIMKRKVDEYHV
jgi:glycine cleavage system H protein